MINKIKIKKNKLIKFKMIKLNKLKIKYINQSILIFNKFKIIKNK